MGCRYLTSHYHTPDRIIIHNVNQLDATRNLVALLAVLIGGVSRKAIREI